MRSKLILSIFLLLFASRILFAAAPTITSFSPASGPVGTVVTITGAAYGGASVKIGGKPAIVISASSTKIVAMVMPGSVTGTITATTTGGTATSATNFAVTTSTFYPTNPDGKPLLGTGGTGKQPFVGPTVALSADGKTAALGQIRDNDSTGAVWIFVRTGDTWTQQGGKLVGTGAQIGGYQGSSLALSADGNTLVEGGQPNGVGAVWIFTRSGSTWSQQSKLVGTGSIGMAQQGYAVAISANGNTVISTGVSDNNNTGAAWIFNRSGTTWTQSGAKIVATGNIGQPGLGSAAAISADGSTALIGGNLDNQEVGATWVFIRNGNTWTQQAKLIGTGHTIQADEGVAVALNADGNTALIGGNTDNNTYGAAWIFTRSGTTWTQQGAKLVPTSIGPGATSYNFGGGTSLTADGKTAYITGTYAGVWVYTLTGGKWVQGSFNRVQQPGYSSVYTTAATISADGQTSAIGTLDQVLNVGLLFIYTAKQPQVITFNQPPAVTYGAADITPAATSTNTTLPLVYKSANAAVATIVNNKIHIVGAGTDTITVSQTGNSTYTDAVPVIRVLTVNKAPLKVIADNQIKDYNFGNPALTCHYVGFVNGDTTTALSYLPTLSTTATQTSPAGTYPIKFGAAAAANYTFTYYGGTLTVYNYPAVTYGVGDFDPKPGYTGVSYTSSNPAVATIVNGKVHVTGAGITTISGKLGTTSGSSGLFVNKDTLFIKANSVVKTQGAANPTFTLTYKGFVYSQTAANLTRRPVITTAATTASGPGTYALNVDGGASPNYIFTYTPGVLAVILKSTSTSKIYTIAGNGAQASSGDGGQATAASMNQPFAMVKDSKGNIFVADLGENKIRRIDAKTKVITTFAGTGLSGFLGDGGLASKAEFNFGYGVGLGIDAADNIYVGDAGNNRIRLIKASTNIITTIAGTGVFGYTGNGGLALSAEIAGPEGIAVDALGNIYFSDTDNNLIRRIDGTTKKISTVAGGGFGIPVTTNPKELATSLLIGFNEHVMLDKTGNLYYTDEANGHIVKVDKTTNYATLIAGASFSGTGYAGDGGLATAAKLDYPDGMAIDSIGTIYFADQVNNAIRRIDGATQIITTVAGTGIRGYSGDNGLATLASLNFPTDVCLDKNGGIYVVDAFNNVIRKVGSSNVIANNIVPLPLAVISLPAPGVSAALSPNGDGKNDVLTVSNIEKYPDNELTLIDGSGKVIYHTLNYDNVDKAFSGRSNLSGKLQPPGTYFYQLRYKDGDAVKSKTGYFVIRY